MEPNSLGELKYNFVFLFAKEDWWDVIFGKEMRNCPNVRIYKGAFKGNKFQQWLFRLHWSYSINSKINLPFKSIWFRKMYKQDFEQKKPLCFVYMGGNKIRFDGGFTNYVRKKSKDNKQVIYHADLISKKCLYDYSVVRDKVDMAITYDKAEAEKYNINFFEEVSFSKPVFGTFPAKYDQDVYFLGAVKDRYKLLLDVHEHLTENGIKCRFLLAGVSEEQQVKRDGIEYIQGITYEENLRNVVRSRCVLEVVQGDSSGITLRTREVLSYGRKLITNNLNVPRHFFAEHQLIVFSSPDEIEISELTENFSAEEVSVNTNPLQWLYYIQNELENR